MPIAMTASMSPAASHRDARLARTETFAWLCAHCRRLNLFSYVRAQPRECMYCLGDELRPLRHTASLSQLP